MVHFNKYGASKTTYNNINYDSKGEARLAQDIDLLIKGGQVKTVERQKRFILYGQGGTKICTHVVDFFVTMPNGNKEVWEFKGAETRDFKIKHKLFLDNYPEIKYLVYKKDGRN